MTTIITRLYPDRKHADIVAAALKADGIRHENIDVISKSPAKMSALNTQIRSAGVYQSAAVTYAGRVAGGEALLVVRAPVGQGLKATEIVNRYESIDAGVKHPDYYRGTTGNSTTVYRTSGTANLLDSNTTILTGRGIIKDSTPFSSMFGMPLLTSGKTGRARLITKKTTWFSSMLGLGLLTHGERKTKLITGKTTWFSSMFGLPLLSGDK